MTEGNQGAAEWLRGIVGEYDAEKSTASCTFMAKLLGIECGDVTCRECMAKMMTTIADRIDAERALPEGIEWPRFEDGELVKMGDEVGFEGETMRVCLAVLDAGGWALWCENDGIGGRLIGSCGERVERPERPEVLDADGVPIKVGDVVYFVADKDDGALTVECIDVSGEKPVVDLVHSDDRGTWHLVDPEKLTHERPDSWERIEDDAYRLVMSEYLDTPEEDVRDLVRRAKALAKKEEA